MSDQELYLTNLYQAVVDMDAEKARSTAIAALEAGVPASDAISKGLALGMKEIGRLWDSMDIFLPEVTAAAEAFQAGLEILSPKLDENAGQGGYLATAVFGTIWGDIHSVGKDIAIPVFRAAGFKVIDLGVDVSVDKYFEAIKEHNANIVGLGTYMGETFAHISTLVDEFKEKGIRDQVLIVCGGPAADDRHAKEMGADGGYDDAWVAVEAVKKMVEARFVTN